MTILNQHSRRRLLFGLGILGLAVAAMVIITVKDGGSDTASATTDGAAMSLEINGQTGKVDVALGAWFDVVVLADAIPLTNGYVLADAWIEFGTDVTYKSAATIWPDCNANSHPDDHTDADT